MSSIRDRIIRAILEASVEGTVTCTDGGIAADRRRAEKAADSIMEILEEDVKCERCGESTMHIGPVCYGCAHKDLEDGDE